MIPSSQAGGLQVRWTWISDGWLGGYVSGTWVLGKTDFSPTKRGGSGVGSVRVGGVDGHEATGAVEVEGKTDAVAEGEEERVAEWRDAGG